MSKLPSIVRFSIRRLDSGAYVATSPDVPGFEAVFPDRDELEKRLVPKYLADFYAAAGQPPPERIEPC